jgi:hypothetical protein
MREQQTFDSSVNFVSYVGVYILIIKYQMFLLR